MLQRMAVGREPLFCPAKELILNYDHLHPDKIKLQAFSPLTGNLLKERVLTAPIAFYTIESLQLNANQMVVLVSQSVNDGSHAFVLVYELDSLLSQAADQDISARMFQIDQPGFRVDSWGRIYVNKTRVCALLVKENSVMFKILDFGNCVD